MGPTPKAPTLSCPVCGTENPASRQFCRKCAADLRAPVPAPGEPIEAPPEPVPMKPAVIGGGIALLAVILLAGLVVVLDTGPAPSSTPFGPSAAPTLGPPLPSLAPTPPVTPPPTIEPTAGPPPSATPRPPRIRSFVAPETIACADPSHSGFIHVRWEVRNATGVTISIDGPGIYKEYEGLTGEDDLPFSCGQPHTYLLTTVGGVGEPATREVIVQPTGV
jgi:hypothetical protein